MHLLFSFKDLFQTYWLSHLAPSDTPQATPQLRFFCIDYLKHQLWWKNPNGLVYKSTRDIWKYPLTATKQKSITGYLCFSSETGRHFEREVFRYGWLPEKYIHTHTYVWCSCARSTSAKERQKTKSTILKTEEKWKTGSHAVIVLPRQSNPPSICTSLQFLLLVPLGTLQTR